MAIDSVTFTPAPTGPNAPEPAPNADPNRPAWLPQNFNSPEDFAKSYGELQAKHTQTSQELAALKKGETPPADPATPPADGETPPADGETPPADDPATKAAQAAGFDLNPFSDEFTQTGDVAEDNRAKIAEGLKSVLGDNARTIVDQYIEGQKATTANDFDLYMTEAGGEETYAAMTSWAAQTLPEAEIAVFNGQLESGNRTAVTIAIQGLRAKYEKANGRQPNILTGKSGIPGSVPGYASTAEMTADMRDPRYKTDPAYRDRVKQRIAAANL
jgi:hypothetical protein